jgi:outer membrane immunogenic protein
MKKLLLTTVALGALGMPAMAADMAPAPVYKAPVPVPVYYNWTGFYVGANAGYAWGHEDLNSNFTCPTGGGAASCAYSFPANLAVVNAAGTGSVSSNGFTGGGQAGYNWQAGSVVYGIETDFDAFSLKQGSHTVTGAFPAAASSYFVTTSSSADWLYTLRGRLGWTVTPTVLLYATGGLALTDLHVNNAFNDNFAPMTAGASAASQTKAGWTVGAGVEFALWQRWTGKVEYLHTDFGSVSTTLTTNTIPAVAGPNVMTTSANLQADLVRVGVNYKFW